MSVTVPQYLYHETTREALKSIEANGLQPKVGAVVQEAYVEQDGDVEISPDPVVFMSDDLPGLGFFCIWQIYKLLGKKNMGQVSVADLEKHGAILFINPKDSQNNIYRMGETHDDIFSVKHRSQVEYYRDREGEQQHIDKLPHSIEDTDWFSVEEVVYDSGKTLKGKKLIDFLRKHSTNHAVVEMFAREAKLKKKVAAKYSLCVAGSR